MTLLLTLIAAVVVTVIWYTSEQARELKVGALCYLYWGASIMWFVDAIFEYAEQGADYFVPAYADMINDAFLGISAITLGLIIWTVILLVKDPKHVFRKAH